MQLHARLALTASVAVMALGFEAAQADTTVCARGVISEIMMSAKETNGANKAAWPRMLVRVDQTGFRAAHAVPGATVNNRIYHVALRLDRSAPYPGAQSISDYRRQLALLQQLMQARTPVRLSVEGSVCAVFPDLLTITACASDGACNR